MNRTINFLFILIVGINTSACQSNNTVKNSQSNESAKLEKSENFVLNPGEIFVTFITDRKPNTDELYQSYLTTVFPVAFKHGAVPMGSLFYDEVASGNFNGTDVIGLTKWSNQEGAMAFAKEMPHEKLYELRKPIWNDLKAFGVPITKKTTYTLREGKVYEYKLVYGETKDIEKSIKKTSKAGGEIILDFQLPIYEDLKGNAAPQKLILVEWDNLQLAKEYRNSNTSNIREEAFYTHFSTQMPSPPAFKTNHLAQTINASPDEVWNVLKTGDDVDKWFPYITSCKLEGSAIGSKRTCTTADGKTLEESITNIDNENRIITYTVNKHNMEVPIHNIKGIMRVKEESGKALVDWTVHFELIQEIGDEMLGQIQAGMVQSMKTGVDGIEELLQ